MAKIINANIKIFLLMALFVIGAVQDLEPKCSDLIQKPTQYPGVCNVYFECENGKLVLRVCQEGSYFNSQSGICDFSQEPKNCKAAQKKKISKKICSRHEITTIADPNNCTKMIVCFLGIPYYKSCELGTAFNNDTGKCDEIQNVPRCSTETNNLNTVETSDDDSGFYNNVQKFTSKTMIKKDLHVNNNIIKTSTAPTIEPEVISYVSSTAQKWTRHW